MKIVILSALLIILTNSYPIAVYNSNLGKKDLFTTSDNLINSLKEVWLNIDLIIGIEKGYCV